MVTAGSAWVVVVVRVVELRLVDCTRYQVSV